MGFSHSRSAEGAFKAAAGRGVGCRRGTLRSTRCAHRASGGRGEAVGRKLGGRDVERRKERMDKRQS